MALLRREKMVTSELDLLALERQKMPWVKIEKSYTLETSEGGDISNWFIRTAFSTDRLSLYVRARLA